MRVLVLQLTLLLTLSRFDGSQALFGNGNKDKRHTATARRRLTEDQQHGQNSVDVDAATGTVTLTEEQARTAEKASTCDGQLAQALVAANDAEHKAQQERDEAVTAKQAALEDIATLQITIAQLEKKVEDFQFQLNNAVTDKETAIQQAVEQKAAELEASEAKLAEAETVVEEAVRVAEQNKDKEIASLQEQLDEIRADAERQLQAQIDHVMADAQGKIADLQAQLEEQKKVSEELLAATKEEAKRVIVEQVQGIKDKLAEVQSQANEAIAAKETEIQHLTKENEGLSKSQELTLRTMRDYEKELEHWRGTFANRSYCNMTHISDDLYESTMTAYASAAQAASTAATKSSEALAVAATHLNTHGRRLTKELSFHAKYGYSKSLEIYNEQYKRHWPKIKPHYDQHVSPLVGQFQQWKAKTVDPQVATLQKEYQRIKSIHIDPTLKKLNTERKKRFVHMVTMFESHCHNSYKLAKQMAKDHDLQHHFDKLDATYKGTCRNPEHSVTIALRTLLVLCLLPFTGRILGMIWSLVRLVWSIFLTVTLLRFILPQRERSNGKRKKMNAGKEQPMPNKVPSNGRVTVKKRGVRKPGQ